MAAVAPRQTTPLSNAGGNTPDAVCMRHRRSSQAACSTTVLTCSPRTAGLHLLPPPGNGSKHCLLLVEVSHEDGRHGHTIIRTEPEAQQQCHAAASRGAPGGGTRLGGCKARAAGGGRDGAAKNAALQEPHDISGLWVVVLQAAWSILPAH